jgi:uncharacterized protein
MFEVAYLFMLAVAAWPLALTLVQADRDNRVAFLHRLYRDAAYILAAVLAIICLEAALSISLENYWFAELGQTHRFWLSIEYRVGIFLAILLLVGVFVGANLGALCRPLAVVPVSAPWIFGFAIAGLIGFLTTALWIPLMRFLGAPATGVADPVFTKDLSFYLLDLPLYDDIVDIGIAVLCLTIVLWLVVGVAVRRGATTLVHRPDWGGAFQGS